LPLKNKKKVGSKPGSVLLPETS